MKTRTTISIEPNKLAFAKSENVNLSKVVDHAIDQMQHETTYEEIQGLIKRAPESALKTILASEFNSSYPLLSEIAQKMLCRFFKELFEDLIK